MIHQGQNTQNQILSLQKISIFR